MLNLIEMMPDPSVFFAQVAADNPTATSDPGSEPPQWRRWYGWTVDRMIAHSAVSAQLGDQRSQQQWAEMLPTYRRPTLDQVMAATNRH